MSGVSSWSYEYPWGRKAPERRIDELRRRRAEVERRRRKLQERFQERMVDFDRQIEAIESEMTLAEKCEADRIRRRLREAAFRLLDIGIDVFQEIDGREPTPELLEQLMAREQRARENLAGTDTEPASSDENATYPEEGTLDDDLVSPDDLQIFMDNPER